MINRNTRQNEQEYKDKRKGKHIKYLDKKILLFTSKLEQMEIAYNNNEANKLYHEMKSIRKGFRPQTFLIGYKHTPTCICACTHSHACFYGSNIHLMMT
jgi:hypothetical protein